MGRNHDELVREEIAANTSHLKRKVKSMTLGELIQSAINLADVGEVITMGKAMDMEIVMPDFLPITGVSIHRVGKKMVFAVSDTED
jgi:hypothetical protein